jgi:hypothetical protein
MEIVPSSMTIAQFCEDLADQKILVNWHYQRSDEVWPRAAQGFLIESILMGFPVPKLFLQQKTDRISRKTLHYIVDGQQRTTAIRSFYNNELRLGRNLELADAAGRTYQELPDDLQGRFLSFALGLDIFVNATEEHVREVFRRINSYEVPLNSEEQRHARWQGDFKWYIYHLSSTLDTYFDRFGTFSDTQLVRMQDMKLLAEVSHALVHGITTTNKKVLDALYEDHDEEFKQGAVFRQRIADGMEYIDTLDSIHGGSLMKAYSLYSLLLAVLHARKRVAKLEPHGKGGKGLESAQVAQRGLSMLAAAVDAETPPRRLARFARATEKGTNVKAKRAIRFEFMLDAVSRDGGKLVPR